MFPEHFGTRRYGYHCNRRRGFSGDQPAVVLLSNVVPREPQDSQAFDGKREDVADTTLRPDDRRRARIAFELAAQAQHLHVNAAVEDV